MPNYQDFMMRHSEHSIQYIIEQIELVEGIKCSVYALLEDRWEALKVSTANDQEAVSQ
jgi:hypothetical protein